MATKKKHRSGLTAQGHLTKKHKAAISTGLKVYWHNLKRAATSSDLSPLEMRSTFKSRKNVSQKGFYSNLKKRTPKAGKANFYNVVWRGVDNTGKVHLSKITAVSGKNKKQLTASIATAIKFDLKGRSLFLEKYVTSKAWGNKGFRQKYTLLKEFSYEITPYKKQPGL